MKKNLKFEKMDLKDFEKKRIMHIDTSSKLYERKDTGITYKIISSNVHKGLALSKKLKKELERDLKIDEDYARIYAICIYYLIKNDLDKFGILVICGDENYALTKKYLDLLFINNRVYLDKKLISLYELREITGKKKLKSYADNTARSYRKRALKSLRRTQVGTILNPVRVSYKNIREKWDEIEKKMNIRNVSGE